MTDVKNAITCGIVFIQQHIDTLNDALMFLHRMESASFDATSSEVTFADGLSLKKSELWKRICDSYCWHNSDVMLKLLEVLIPGADSYRYDFGGIRVIYHNITIYIPTTLSDDVDHKCIHFYYNHTNVDSYPTMQAPCNQEFFARRYALALRSNAPLHVLLKLRAPTLHPIRRYFMYFTRWYWNDRKEHRTAEYYDAVVANYTAYRSEEYKKDMDLYVQCVKESLDYEVDFLPTVMAFADGYFDVDLTFFIGKHDMRKEGY